MTERKSIKTYKEFDNELDKIHKQNLETFKNALLEALKPVPNISIADWCESNLVLPPEMTAEPGAYSLERTPYLKEILDCLHPSSPYNEIVFYAGTQLGKTQALICAISYLVANAPANMLFGFSNKDQKNAFVQERLNPFIDANPVLKSKFIARRKNEKAEKQNSKSFAGGTLFFASAEAPADFRSHPCRYVFADELDSYPLDAKGEGSPVELAKRRTSTFNGRYKIYLCSTTTNRESQIKARYEETDQRQLFFNCPYCNFEQTLDWSRFNWNADGTFVKDVWYTCPHCNGEIRNEQKTELLKNAHWKATNNQPTDPKKVGFYLPGLWSPVGWQDWNSCVTSYLEATSKNDETKLTAFYNTILAQPYETSSDVPQWDRLLERANHSNYNRGEIPNNVIFLTSFTDVQMDRLETTIIGWGKFLRSYVIDHLILLCPQGTTTSDPNNRVFAEWENLIYRNEFTRLDGVPVRIIANGIDRSYNTSSVSEFCSRFDTKTVIACRGNERLQTPISAIKKALPASNKSEQSRSQFRTNLDKTYYYIETGVSTLKADLYRLLKDTDTPNQDRYMYVTFARGLDEEYFRQLTAEHYVAPTQKHPKGIWIKDRNRNECLDTFVGNIAMVYYSTMNTLTDQQFDELESELIKQKNTQGLKQAQTRKIQYQRRILNKGY